ncbi:MAG TPA: diguanylate cyclase, partial [Albitalea sp.]|nr:diguanylate cyclase [Albitalea sp.]
LRAAVAAHPWEEVAEGVAVTISLGLAQAQGNETPMQLVARADAALYEAKRLGRNRLCMA